uniref:Uncharacterized protein n=1 Tax=viral metagenome TaxID=1070528 RepID=A0A6H1ZC54_9ZZZZ
MRVIGQIIELDPSKKYIMVVKEGSRLSRTIHTCGTEGILYNGRIFFIGDFEDFRLIENSDRIAEIAEESI